MHPGGPANKPEVRDRLGLLVHDPKILPYRYPEKMCEQPIQKTLLRYNLPFSGAQFHQHKGWGQNMGFTAHKFLFPLPGV